VIFGNFSVPFKTVGKLIVPDNAEIKENNRARSAKLRIAERYNLLHEKTGIQPFKSTVSNQ
jgi:hypothetical protein